MGSTWLPHRWARLGCGAGSVNPPKIPERPLRRDFPAPSGHGRIFLACGANRPGAPFAEGFFAQRGHAPRRAKPRGIFLPRPGTDGFQVFVTEILGWL